MVKLKYAKTLEFFLLANIEFSCFTVLDLNLSIIHTQIDICEKPLAQLKIFFFGKVMLPG